MPRFHIDTSDQQIYMWDEVGTEFEDVEAAMDAAVEGLSDMARDVLPGGEHRTLLAVVRDDQGKTLCQATMSFGVVWMSRRA